MGLTSGLQYPGSDLKQYLALRICSGFSSAKPNNGRSSFIFLNENQTWE